MTFREFTRGAAVMPPPVRINHHAPTRRVVDAVADAGWGELRSAPQSVRTLLLALGRLGDARSGTLETTDAQLAERTGLTPRTVLSARHWLMENGFVQMVRRGARQGLVGVASVLKVAKKALVALLPSARAEKDARARARAGVEGGAPNLKSRQPFPFQGKEEGATCGGARSAGSAGHAQRCPEHDLRLSESGLCVSCSSDHLTGEHAGSVRGACGRCSR